MAVAALASDVAGFKAETKAGFAEFKAETRAGFAALQGKDKLILEALARIEKATPPR